MKIALFSRIDNPSLDDFIEVCCSLGVDYVMNPSDVTGLDFAVSFGGDGTFLSGVRKMGDCAIPILGVNSGRLGFLATVSKSDARRALEALSHGRFTIERRTMLNVDGGGSPCLMSRALNEFTIQKNGTSMISINIEIDHQPVATYWADGVIVSTPTGSTAYSMSVGGAILTPGCRCFGISPIAPHNLNIRPLVVPDSSFVRLTVSTRMGADSIATIDNREWRVLNGACFSVVCAQRELEVVKLPDSSFYDTLRDKLMWGVDLRN